MQAAKYEKRVLNGSYLSLFLINMIVSSSFYMVSTTMSLYVTGFGASVAVAGTVVGALSIASMCVRPFSGLLSDRFSRKHLLTFSLLGVSLAMAGCGLTSSVPLLIAFRILHGLSFSIATTVIMALVAGTLPPERMTQGLGYFAVGQTITSAFAPSLGIWMGNAYGYPFTFKSAAVLVFLAVILALFIIRPQDRPSSRLTRKLTVSDFISLEALPFGILAIAVAGTTGIENGFVALYGKQIGLGNVGWYFTIGAVALLLSRILSGKLADKNSSLVIYLGLFFMSAAFLLLGISVTGNAMILFAAAAVLKALGLGAVQPALQAASLKSVPADKRGAASSTYYLGTDVGQAFAPILGGRLASAQGYNTMFLLYTLPQLLGAVFYFLFKRRHSHQRKEDSHEGIASDHT
jgi:predicted MFS family arabinose efflux permease